MILTKGSVRGEMIDYSGRLIKVEDIAAPRALAPLFLFGEENRFPVEVTANELTEVIEIPKSSVLELFRKNEQFLENYMNLSANYARTLSDKLFFMSFKTIRAKDSILSAPAAQTTATAADHPRPFATGVERLLRCLPSLSGT